ncbi:MAG: nucleotidyltransferase domain-containing protein [Chloroflexi bacterium]|nr:nucleotidyltransferase domain-containing protein [Chloroflexota bacterium]
MHVSPELSIESLAPGLADVFAPHPIAAAYIFGSAARGQMTPFSDIDVALLLTAGCVAKSDHLKFELSLEAEIAERCGLSETDVRIINDAPLIVRGRVLTEGVLLYVRDDEFRIDFETRTRTEYFDFLPAVEYLREAFFADVRKRGLDGQHSEN